MFIANGAVFGGCEKGIIGGFHLPIFMSILLEMRSLPRPRFNRFFLGSGPGRGRSPVEWGDFPFVRLSVCPFVRLSVRSSVRLSVRSFVRLFYRTSSPMGAAALPPPMKTKEKVERGKGTADHLMPLGYFLKGLLRTLTFQI